MMPEIRRPRVRIAAAVALSTLAVAILTMPSGDVLAKSRHRSSLYWGAQIGTQLTGTYPPWDMRPVQKFQHKVGKKLSLIGFSAPFANCSGSSCSFIDFPTTPLDNVRQYGAIPFFSWSSASSPIGVFQENFQLADVINGNFDQFIQKFAASARDWGHPFFLRFNWEMNGDWYPWSERRNGNKPGQYVAAWRHVHDIFAANGASNVSWVWCPNVEIRASASSSQASISVARFQRLRALYPGDRYVDWTCLDGFNWGRHPVNPVGWRSFDQTFRGTYRKVVRKIAPGKPMIIGETASTDRGGSKAHWIRDMLAQLPTRFRKIRGFVWFDTVDRHIDWPIEASRRTTRAFRKGIRRSAYKQNNFGNISASPIPPPH